ncbi:retron system putative HNH endonuclease [Cupriavidus alkaliphilus]|uniref:retron system putative HNH endonuclease n=1 Tax=Cupriavidus alkaliphilus TaxID=942866 RepID=UPI0016147440|nr:retron system putative HNH endonuclease [Cupriavidus alkaliphilus]MBB3014034.1 uncharacterized protein (TIGR02646 family) [Cupriavidus alkaliphilus]
MRYTRKGVPPAEFVAWTDLATEDWEPTFDQLQNPEKRILLQALIREQGGVCCYCGRAIGEENSHVEHFRPQERFPQLELSFHNLHASCYRMPAPEATHCGHFKGNRFDEALHISPLDPECESRFIYTAMGGIAPSLPDDERADHMLEILGLDAPFLRAARAAVLSAMDAEFMATATAEELEALQVALLQGDANGDRSYAHVLARFIEQYM